MHENDTEHLLTLKHQGLALVQSNRFAEAQMLFRKVCDADTKDAEAWLILSTKSDFFKYLKQYSAQ